jgi:hypothetical protein
MLLALLTVMHPVGGEIPCQVLTTAIASHSSNADADFFAASFLNVHRFILDVNMRAYELTLLLNVAT